LEDLLGSVLIHFLREKAKMKIVVILLVLHWRPL